MIDAAIHSGGCNVGMVIGFGKVFALGEDFGGGGGGSDLFSPTVGFGVGDSR